MLLGSAVPLSVGVLLAVILSLLLVPVSFTESAGNTPVGEFGAIVSSVTGTEIGAPTLPAESVAFTIKLFKPSAKYGPVGSILHVPVEPTTTEPSTVVPSGAYRVIVSPGVPVPIMAGLLFLVILSVWLLPVSFVASCVNEALVINVTLGVTAIP